MIRPGHRGQVPGPQPTQSPPMDMHSAVRVGEAPSRGKTEKAKRNEFQKTSREVGGGSLPSRSGPAQMPPATGKLRRSRARGNRMTNDNDGPGKGRQAERGPRPGTECRLTVSRWEGGLPPPGSGGRGWNVSRAWGGPRGPRRRTPPPRPADKVAAKTRALDCGGGGGQRVPPWVDAA